MEEKHTKTFIVIFRPLLDVEDDHDDDEDDDDDGGDDEKKIGRKGEEKQFCEPRNIFMLY